MNIQPVVYVTGIEFKALSKKEVRAKGVDKNKALSAKQEVDGQISEVELMSTPV